MTASDVRRIAAALYGTEIAPGDAAKIARSAGGTLANLHYLDLLKSDDVQPPFGYPAMIDEASRS